ncbi:hypothetical protein ACIGG9_16575 [Pseudonocardia alni]|uniref:hypothetical protein n=1 Tax=Pseudonocardia alni TaxID=33907 RepID=UPI0037C98812
MDRAAPGHDHSAAARGWGEAQLRALSEVDRPGRRHGERQVAGASGRRRPLTDRNVPSVS